MMLDVHGIGESEAISRDSGGIFLSSNFKQTSFGGEIAKNRDLITSDFYSYPQQQQQQQQQQQNSGLLRYRSAPSTFFSELIDGDCIEEFLNHPFAPSNESEPLFTNFISCNDSGNSNSQGFNEINQTNSQFLTPAKQEVEEIVLQQNGFSTAASNPINYGRAPASSAAAFGSYSMATENNNNSSQVRPDSKNLVRQSSSPPEFLSGFSVTGRTRNCGSGNGTNGDTSSSAGRLSNQMNFSTGTTSRSRFMDQTVENGNDSCRTDTSGNENLRNGNISYSTSALQNDSWNRNDSSFSFLKRNADGELKVLSGNGLESQNASSGNYTTGLTHHLSLPKTSAEMAAVEKYLQFQQDSVPCKIRAKRGCATHPRSIAERNRRTRISERIKMLQDLFPDIDKQTNTSDMLDMAIEYIKELQKQVQKLTDTKAQCTCCLSDTNST